MRELKSDNYNPGLQGWRISANGKAEFQDGVFRGKIVASEGVIGGWNIGSTRLRAGNIGLYSSGDYGGAIEFYNNLNERKGYLSRYEAGKYFGFALENRKYFSLEFRDNGEVLLSTGNSYAQIFLNSDTKDIILSHGSSSKASLSILIDRIGLSKPNYNYHQIWCIDNYIFFNPKNESGNRIYFGWDGTNYAFCPTNDNEVLLGASNKRWKQGCFVNLYCSNQVSGQYISGGDFIFKNDWVITEEEDALVFVNPKKEKVLKIESSGEIKKLSEKETYDYKKHLKKGEKGIESNISNSESMDSRTFSQQKRNKLNT